MKNPSTTQFFLVHQDTLKVSQFIAFACPKQKHQLGNKSIDYTRLLYRETISSDKPYDEILWFFSKISLLEKCKFQSCLSEAGRTEGLWLLPLLFLLISVLKTTYVYRQVCNRCICSCYNNNFCLISGWFCPKLPEIWREDTGNQQKEEE